MSETASLERMLAALRAPAGARGPRLDQRRRARLRDASVLLSVGPGDDPLTGLRHRGEGASVVAEVGPVTLVAHLRQEENGGLTLRGQVVPAALAAGGIVHVQGSSGEPAIGAIAEDGAFGILGLREAPTALVVELDDSCWRIAWGAGAGSSA
jgi:hypothetical protein